MLLLFLIFPVRMPVVDHVDMVELNHFYQTSDGSHVFDQLIWYSWNIDQHRYDVIDWRLLRGVRYEVTAKQKENHRLGIGPDPCPPVGKWKGGHATPVMRDGRYVSQWQDDKTRTYRRVIATTMRETWTIYDPELAARELLPQMQRRGLSKH